MKNLQAEGLQLHKKDSNTDVFLRSFANILRIAFLRGTPPVAASTTPVAVSIFLFKKYYLTAISLPISTHRLMYKKSNSFVYEFVVNCQVF